MKPIFFLSVLVLHASAAPAADCDPSPLTDVRLIPPQISAQGDTLTESAGSIIAGPVRITGPIRELAGVVESSGSIAVDNNSEVNAQVPSRVSSPVNQNNQAAAPQGYNAGSSVVSPQVPLVPRITPQVPIVNPIIPNNNQVLRGNQVIRGSAQADANALFNNNNQFRGFVQNSAQNGVGFNSVIPQSNLRFTPQTARYIQSPVVSNLNSQYAGFAPQVIPNFIPQGRFYQTGPYFNQYYPPQFYSQTPLARAFIGCESNLPLAVPFAQPNLPLSGQASIPLSQPEAILEPISPNIASGGQAFEQSRPINLEPASPDVPAPSQVSSGLPLNRYIGDSSSYGRINQADPCVAPQRY